MSKQKIPVTAATRFLKQSDIKYDTHLYKYEDKSGAAGSALALGVDNHTVIKTLVFQDDSKKLLIVLMHGDCEVSTKSLARQLRVKSITPCSQDNAFRSTGYKFGGTSPFGTKKKLPIYFEETIVELPIIYINGGKRGFLMSMEPKQAMNFLKATAVNVAITD